MRTRARGLAAALALGLLALAAAGCARPVGDFGRAEPSVLHDRFLPAAGEAVARRSGEPVSELNLTDQEREMHDRVWRFLVAPHAHDWFYDTAVELQRTRLAGARDMTFQPDRYYSHLRARDFASSRVRYQAVSSDIGADLATLPTTFRAICAVVEVDRQRAVAVTHVARGAPDGPAQVAARKWENDRRIDWFVRALGYRYESYSLALDRLLVETPHEEGRVVDRRLSELAQWVARAQRHDFCASPAEGGAGGGAPLPSRLSSQPFSPEPIYRK